MQSNKSRRPGESNAWNGKSKPKNTVAVEIINILPAKYSVHQCNMYSVFQHDQYITKESTARGSKKSWAMPVQCSFDVSKGIGSQFHFILPKYHCICRLFVFNIIPNELKVKCSCDKICLQKGKVEVSIMIIVLELFRSKRNAALQKCNAFGVMRKVNSKLAEGRWKRQKVKLVEIMIS